jgi:YebC/PmpR family DNA-binding regulatory protein
MGDIERTYEKLERTIALAAGEQGADPEQNIWLRCAIARARRKNLDDRRIEAAVDRGAGRTDEPTLQSATYEGYGPRDVAVFIRAITEDPLRTREELAEIFEEHGGSLGEDGSVAWQFDRRGLVLVEAASVEDRDMFELDIIEMGGDELGEPLYDDEDDRATVYRVYSEGDGLLSLAEALDEESYDVWDVQWVREPTQRIGLESEDVRRFLAFNEKLNARPDIQDVYSNWTSAR